MKRALLIATLVLVPFAGLVAFGFSLLTDPPPMVLPPPVARLELPPPPPTPVAAPVRVAGPLRHALDVSIPVVDPIDPVLQQRPGVAPPPVELSDEARRLPLVAAVEPLVMQCFKDVAGRVREPLRVTVAFDTTATGGFSGVVIKKSSWQDPHLAACILDAFEDAHFEPSGVVLRRQSRTFTYGAPDGGP